MAGSTDGNRALVEQLYERVWNAHDIEALDDFYTPGEHLDGLKRFARDLIAAFPDWHVEINEIVVEGDRVAVYWTGTGTQQNPWEGLEATGRQGTLRGIDIEIFSDGRIAEEDGVLDLLGMLRQLGAILVSM